MPILATQGMNDGGAAGRPGSPVIALIMVIAGAAAIALPVAAGFGALTVAAAVLLLAGGAHALYSLATHHLRAFAWHALIGLAYIAGGAYMLMNPGVGVASIALVIGVLFVVEGLLLVGAWWASRSQAGASWMLANGALTALLGVLVLVAFPEASAAIVGLLVGVNLIVSGLSRLFHRTDAR